MARKDPPQKTAGVNEKIKNKSATPASNEQVARNRGGRTGRHARHLPRLPLGNIGIECTSTTKHYTPPET